MTVDLIQVGESGLKFGAFSLKPTGLLVKGKPSFDEWEQCGKVLQRIEGAVQWWLGDWLNYGEKRYGEKYSQALEATGYAVQTLMDAAWVASKIEISLRKEILPYNVQKEVASLTPEQQAAVLADAEAEAWTVLDTRRAVRQIKARIGPASPMPTEEFAVLYADPPWRYEHVETENRAIENQYPTMELDDICALEVPAAEDAVLFLWATSPKLSEAMHVLTSWGFTYRTCMVWVKDKIGMGYYARQQHELLLIGVKGEPPVPAEADRPPSVLEAPRTGHSVKPPEFYALIERMYPGFQKIELFARATREGWTTWGNQAAT
jgi:N6-adenosine-specific RNA methylase IME4